MTTAGTYTCSGKVNAISILSQKSGLKEMANNV